MTSVHARPADDEMSAPEQGGAQAERVAEILELQYSSVYVVILYVPSPLHFALNQTQRKPKTKTKTKKMLLHYDVPRS